jgi:hypothetical protein
MRHRARPRAEARRHEEATHLAGFERNLSRTLVLIEEVRKV